MGVGFLFFRLVSILGGVILGSVLGLHCWDLGYGVLGTFWEGVPLFCGGVPLFFGWISSFLGLGGGILLRLHGLGFVGGGGSSLGVRGAMGGLWRGFIGGGVVVGGLLGMVILRGVVVGGLWGRYITGGLLGGLWGSAMGPLGSQL